MIGQVMTEESASRAVSVDEHPVQSRTAALNNIHQRLAKILDHSCHLQQRRLHAFFNATTTGSPLNIAIELTDNDT
jgi:hypothetical protein